MKIDELRLPRGWTYCGQDSEGHWFRNTESKTLIVVGSDDIPIYRDRPFVQKRQYVSGWDELPPVEFDTFDEAIEFALERMAD